MGDLTADVDETSDKQPYAVHYHTCQYKKVAIFTPT